MEKLLVSVSGGRTSALMAKMLWDRFQNKYEMIFVFANTSREEEATLEFLHGLEVNFGLPIIWVEAVVHHNTRKSCTHRIVDYYTANRNGDVFEDMIRKYGIPNKQFKHCTRELKTNPIRSYAKSIGWSDFKKYTTVIGYRADEPKRVNLLTIEEKGQWYPLWDWGIKKPDVAHFWLKQSFDLNLEDWEGNCKLCHKKSKRKLLTKIVKDPKSVEWHKRVEPAYEQVKPKHKEFDDTPVRFFRSGESILDLIEESKEPFNIAVDQSLITIGAEYDFELDEQEDCAESCEPF